MMLDSDKSDLLLALELFDGKLTEEPAPGKPRLSTLGRSFEFSADELAARHHAIARLLRSAETPRDLLERLADAFDGASQTPVKASIRLAGQNTPNLELQAIQTIIRITEERRVNNLPDALAAVDELQDKRNAAKSIWESPRWRELRARIRAFVNPE